MGKTDKKRNKSNRDIKRILTINDPSFFALACNSLEEAIISDWYCKENKISKEAYKYCTRGLYDAVQYVREYTTGAEDKKFDILLDSIQTKKDDINAIRHDFFSIAYDHAMEYGSDLLEFVDSFKRKFSYAGITDEDLIEFKKEIEERRNNDKYLEKTQDYFRSYKIAVSKYIELEEKYQLLSKNLDEANTVINKTTEAKNEANNKVAELRLKYDNLRKENFDVKESTRKQIEEYEHQIDDCERQINDYDNTLNEYKDKVDDLNKQLQEIPISREDLLYIRELSGFAINRRKYEKGIMKLSPEQDRIIKEVDINKNACINGGAGTGKTLVLLKLIEKVLQNNPNASFILIVYTNSFVNYLKYIAPLLNKEVSKKIEENSSTLAKINKKAKYDYVFVDEIQDFSLEELSDIKGLVKKSLIFAGDANQAIYKKYKNYGSLEKAGITDYKVYSLCKNFRSTIQINSLAEEYKNIVIANQAETGSCFQDSVYTNSFSIRDGMPVSCILCEKPVNAVVERIRKILELGEYDENSICVLTPTGKVASKVKNLLEKMNYSVSFYKDKDYRTGLDFRQNGIKVSTIHSAKGADFPYVLFCATDFFKEVNNYELIYTAITRATDRLEVYFNCLNDIFEGDEVKNEALLHLWGIVTSQNKVEE